MPFLTWITIDSILGAFFHGTWIIEVALSLVRLKRPLLESTVDQNCTECSLWNQCCWCLQIKREPLWWMEQDFCESHTEIKRENIVAVGIIEKEESNIRD